MTSSGQAKELVMIDSSSWIETLRPDGSPRVRDRVRQLLLSGSGAWCEIVRLELWRGVRDRDEEKSLLKLESVVVNLSTDAKAWEICLLLSHAARKKGHRPPATDVIIAATAKRHSASVEHNDRHMEFLSSLRIS